MLRDRGLLLRAGTVVPSPLGVQPPDAPLVWRELAPCSLEGDRRSPGAPLPLGSGASLAPCSPWYGVTTNPQPLPYSLYEGRCIRCPGFTLWQSTSLKRTRRSSAVSLEGLARSTKGEQVLN